MLCVGIAADNGAAAAGRLGKHSVARRLVGLEAATAGAFLSALRTREARQEAAREARAKIAMAEAREKIEAWRNGAPGHPPYVPGVGPLLRAVNVERDESGNVAGGELQTTQGARVPLTHAIRVFRFLKLCRERGEGWKANGRFIRVGHFTVDRIESNGDFVAGCHSIRWAEVAALAERLGLADLAADDSAAVARASA